jgi:hypothetical protein
VANVRLKRPMSGRYLTGVSMVAPRLSYPTDLVEGQAGELLAEAATGTQPVELGDHLLFDRVGDVVAIGVLGTSVCS